MPGPDDSGQLTTINMKSNTKYNIEVFSRNSDLTSTNVSPLACKYLSC